ncbi:hypothetical protein [Nocardia sp. NPDC047038]|uniref:hypothetical protein n=1 Tax=Nocardia sp. NPDC047038 TaxID=3154338 RepID=UPI0033C148A1
MATLDDDDIAAATVGDLRPCAAGVVLEEYTRRGRTGTRKKKPRYVRRSAMWRCG